MENSSLVLHSAIKRIGASSKGAPIALGLVCHSDDR